MGADAVTRWPGRHFQPSEFLCQCGRDSCDAPTIPEPALVALLDGIREDLWEPITITSGLRCSAHNAALGGEVDSGHLTGTEVDVACPTSAFRFRLVSAALRHGVRRLGIYKRHVHIGLSTTPLPKDVMWLG